MQANSIPGIVENIFGIVVQILDIAEYIHDNAENRLVADKNGITCRPEETLFQCVTARCDYGFLFNRIICLPL